MRISLMEFLSRVEEIVNKEGNTNKHGDDLKKAYIGVVGDRNFYAVIEVHYNDDDNRFELTVEEE